MPRQNVYAEDGSLAGWFDPDAAEWIREETRWNGSNHVGVISGLQCGYQGLYRTAGGRWVLHHDGSREFNGPVTWRFIDSRQAREWLLMTNKDDVVEKYFGAVESESGPDLR